jgi:hypothetical protein
MNDGGFNEKIRFSHVDDNASLLFRFCRWVWRCGMWSRFRHLWGYPRNGAGAGCNNKWVVLYPTIWTSNCDASGIVLAEKEQEMFVEKNFPNLAREMAAGGGEHLQTLAALLGCPSDKATQFAAFTQQNYEVIFVSDRTTPTDMLNTVKDKMAKDPALSVSCSN